MINSAWEAPTINKEYSNQARNRFIPFARQEDDYTFHQCTLKHTVPVHGIGRYSGERVTMIIRPAPVNTGILFRRIDLKPVVSLPVTLAFMQPSSLHMNLVKGHVSVCDITCLMSAFVGLGIDNAYIDLTHSEVPYMDGSAEPFVFLIQSAGTQVQSAAKQPSIQVTRKIHVFDKTAWVAVEPCNILRITYQIPAGVGEPQQYGIVFSQRNYIKLLSRARRGVDPFSPKIELRYSNELMRSHLWGMLGNLYVSGRRLLGAFTGYRAGPMLYYRLMKHLLEMPEVSYSVNPVPNYNRMVSF